MGIFIASDSTLQCALDLLRCKVPVRSFQLRDQNEMFEIVGIVCALTV